MVEIPPPTDNERYLLALRSVQTGIAFLMGDKTVPYDGVLPKHLRVGITSNQISDTALARLLVAKGLFTWDEYHKELADEAEREVARLKLMLEQRYPGVKITLAPCGPPDA